MNIAVCIKLVPDTTADIRVAPDGQALQLANVEWVINPYDEYALEAALQTREAFAGSVIHALSIGDDEAAKCLRHALALGVDHAWHIRAAAALAANSAASGTHSGEPCATGSHAVGCQCVGCRQAHGQPTATAARGTQNTVAAALAAAKVLRGLNADLILCGRQACDDDQWLFPGMLAELLDIPHITAAATLTIAPSGKTIQCRRRFYDGEQLMEAPLPAVVSCDKGLNEPRVPLLKGRLEAKKKQPLVKTLAELGVTSLESALARIAYLPPAQKKPGQVIGGSPAQAAAELVRLLRDEAQVL